MSHPPAIDLSLLPPGWAARITVELASPELGECWRMSRGWNTGNGYAKVRDRGRCVVAHRAIYRRLVAEIPPGFVLDHLCRNRDCVRPSHLEPISVRENTRRGAAVLFVKAE